MIFGLGTPEILIILLVVLVIFGPKNLPKLGSALGKTVKNVREGMDSEEGDDSNTETEDSTDESTEQKSE